MPACINQRHSCSRYNTTLFGMFPCQKDNYLSLAVMAELYVPDIEDLRTNGVTVAGVMRPVHMRFMGNFSFTKCFAGHAGPACRFP